MPIFLVLLQKLKDFIGLKILFVAFFELLLDKHFIGLQDILAFARSLLLLGLKFRFSVALLSFADFTQCNEVHRIGGQSFGVVIILFGVDFIRKEIVFRLRRHVFVWQYVDPG